MQNFVQQKSDEIKELIKAEAVRLWRKDQNERIQIERQQKLKQREEQKFKENIEQGKDEVKVEENLAEGWTRSDKK